MVFCRSVDWLCFCRYLWYKLVSSANSINYSCVGWTEVMWLKFDKIRLDSAELDYTCRLWSLDIALGSEREAGKMTGEESRGRAYWTEQSSLYNMSLVCVIVCLSCWKFASSSDFSDFPAVHPGISHHEPDTCTRRGIASQVHVH